MHAARAHPVRQAPGPARPSRHKTLYANGNPQPPWQRFVLTCSERPHTLIAKRDGSGMLGDGLPAAGARPGHGPTAEEKAWTGHA